MKENELTITLSKRIKERRLAAGFRTTGEAAAQVNMKRPAYKHYESGLRIPPLPMIKSLGDAFKTNPAYLAGWTDNPDPEG